MTMHSQTAAAQRADDALVDPSDDGESAAIVKAILELDALLGLIRRTTPASKPWQRDLLGQLIEADREMEVLRLTIAMERSADETAAAAVRLQETLARARVWAGRSRADGNTKVSIFMADVLGRHIRAGFESVRAASAS